MKIGEEIPGLVIAIVVFAVVAIGVAILLSGKGTDILRAVKDVLRFG